MAPPATAAANAAAASSTRRPTAQTERPCAAYAACIADGASAGFGQAAGSHVSPAGVSVATPYGDEKARRTPPDAITWEAYALLPVSIVDLATLWKPSAVHHAEAVRPASPATNSRWWKDCTPNLSESGFERTKLS